MTPAQRSADAHRDFGARRLVHLHVALQLLQRGRLDRRAPISHAQPAHHTPAPQPPLRAADQPRCGQARVHGPRARAVTAALRPQRRGWPGARGAAHLARKSTTLSGCLALSTRAMTMASVEMYFSPSCRATASAASSTAFAAALNGASCACARRGAAGAAGSRPVRAQARQQLAPLARGLGRRRAPRGRWRAARAASAGPSPGPASRSSGAACPPGRGRAAGARA